jgi:hypothetical protein
MGGETPKTCWATHKSQVINLWNCWILLVELFESYDDARTYECQIYTQYIVHSFLIFKKRERAKICTKQITNYKHRAIINYLEKWKTQKHAKRNTHYSNHSSLHAKQSSIQNNKYQVSHKYSCFSWWWVYSRSKHVQRKKINILRKIVHQVGFVYKIVICKSTAYVYFKMFSHLRVSTSLRRTFFLYF